MKGADNPKGTIFILILLSLAIIFLWAVIIPFVSGPNPIRVETKMYESEIIEIKGCRVSTANHTGLDCCYGCGLFSGCETYCRLGDIIRYQCKYKIYKEKETEELCYYEVGVIKSAMEAET